MVIHGHIVIALTRKHLTSNIMHLGKTCAHQYEVSCKQENIGIVVHFIVSMQGPGMMKRIVLSCQCRRLARFHVVSVWSVAARESEQWRSL